MHIKFQNSPLKGGTNSGSCGALLNYLEKEDKNRDDEHELKGFFNSERSDLTNDEAKKEIEHQYFKKGLKSDADKFYTVTMSFSQEELKGRTNKELIEFAQEKFPQMYANAIQGKELEPEKLNWVAKLEEERKLKGTDNLVKEGLAKSGAVKDGDQRHMHFVIARKTNDGKRQVSPMTNHFKNASNKGAVKSGFDQYHMVFEAEKEFDKRFDYNRERKDSVLDKTEFKTHRPDLIEKFDVEKQRTQAEKKERRDKQIKEIKELQSSIKDNSKEIESALKRFKEKVKEVVKKVISAPQKALQEILRKPKKKEVDFQNMTIKQKLDFVEEQKIKEQSQKQKPKENTQDKDQSNDRSRGR